MLILGAGVHCTELLGRGAFMSHFKVEPRLHGLSRHLPRFVLQCRTSILNQSTWVVQGPIQRRRTSVFAAIP